VAEFRKNLDKRGRKVKGERGVMRRQEKKPIILQTAMTKKVVSFSFFQKKIGVTPSFAAPGDLMTPLARGCIWCTCTPPQGDQNFFGVIYSYKL